MNIEQMIHDSICNDVKHKIQRNGEFAVTDISYGDCHLIGQIDVMKYNKDGRPLALYEIKSNDSQANRNHAKDQLRRAYHHFDERVYGVYVSYDRKKEDFIAKIMFRPL